MTGEEFLDKVREIKEIQIIYWDFQGDPYNADKVWVEVVADNGKYIVSLGSPVFHSTLESFNASNWHGRVATLILVNKTMELLGRPERFDIGYDNGDVSDAVNFAIECIQERDKTQKKSGDFT